MKARIIAAIEALPDDCLMLHALAHHLGLAGRRGYLDDADRPWGKQEQ